METVFIRILPEDRDRLKDVAKKLKTNMYFAISLLLDRYEREQNNDS